MDLLGPIDASERAPRSRLSLVRGQSTPHVFVFEQREVGSNLPCELALRAIWTEKRAKPCEECP